MQEDSKWVKIAKGETKRLRFVLESKPEYKEDNFQGHGTGVMKTFWTVIEEFSQNPKRKIFKTASKSTRLISIALRETRDYVLDITHEGEGFSTIYRPKVVNPKKQQEEEEEEEDDE